MTNTTGRVLDITFALNLARHIDNPCTVQVGDKEENIRSFYLRQAEIALFRLESPYARDFLQSKIDEYKPRASSQ